MKFTLRGLSPADINLVIAALGRCAYDDVYHLLQSIHAQAQRQTDAHNRRPNKLPAPPPEKL